MAYAHTSLFSESLGMSTSVAVVLPQLEQGRAVGRRVETDHRLVALHVADVVAAAAQRQGFARVGVLGTRWTLGWRRYADELEPMGLTAVPLPLWDQTTLHSIIFDELAHGRVTLRSRDTVLAIIDGLRRQGCQAVVLGCPDLSSLITPASTSLRLLDATTLLADSALAVAAGDAPLPRWRGGRRLAEIDLDPRTRYSTH